MHVEPILAAGNDWIVGLLTLGIPVVIWIFNRVLGQMNQPGQQGQAQQRGQRAPQAGVPRPDDEVQEFLKRVRERRKEVETVEVIRPAQQPRPTGQQAGPRKPTRDRGSRNRGQAAPTKAPPRPPAEPLPSDAPSPPRPLGSRISDQVARDIDTRDVTEHLEHLTTVDQADEQMEAHIKSAFSHKLGQFESTLSDDEKAGAIRAAEKEAAPSMAAVIRSQLASPDGVRQAVLMREILDRPTHRW